MRRLRVHLSPFGLLQLGAGLWLWLALSKSASLIMHEKCLEEAVGEGQRAGRRKVVVAVAGRDWSCSGLGFGSVD